MNIPSDIWYQSLLNLDDFTDISLVSRQINAILKSTNFWRDKFKCDDLPIFNQAFSQKEYTRVREAYNRLHKVLERYDVYSSLVKGQPTVPNARFVGLYSPEISVFTEEIWRGGIDLQQFLADYVIDLIDEIRDGNIGISHRSMLVYDSNVGDCSLSIPIGKKKADMFLLTLLYHGLTLRISSLTIAPRSQRVLFECV